MEQNTNDKRELEIISKNNENYKIIFENSSKFLIIKASPKNSEKIYSNNFSLEYFQKIKLFIAFDNIGECLDEIFDRMDINKTLIIEQSNKLKLIINLKSKKYNEIVFELDTDIDNSLTQMNNMLKKLTIENKELKEEITILKQEIKEIKNSLGNRGQFNYIIYKDHHCALVLVDYKNKQEIYKKYGGWSCNVCRTSYNNEIPNFYCPKCNYDLCLECFGKNN